MNSKTVIDKIIGALELRDDDFVIEIGPGHGELTNELLASNAKRKVVVIEKDKNLSEGLAQKFSTHKNLSVVEGDALRELSSVISRLAPKNQRYVLLGNLPYYITGHLLRVIGELEKKPERCVFMLQKEVAERIAAQPPRMNRLAASVQFWAEPKIITSVPRKYFLPPPKVDSAVILLEVRPKPLPADEEKYYVTVHALFAQPRKTVLNNVATSQLPIADSKKEKITQALALVGIEAGKRPQDLSVEDIIRIAEL